MKIKVKTHTHTQEYKIKALPPCRRQVKNKNIYKVQFILGWIGERPHIHSVIYSEVALIGRKKMKSYKNGRKRKKIKKKIPGTGVQFAGGA